MVVLPNTLTPKATPITIKWIVECIKTSVDLGIPVTDGWRILDRLLEADNQPPLAPAYVCEEVARHLEEVFQPEKVWTVLQTAAYIRTIEVHGIKVKQDEHWKQNDLC